MKRRLVFLSHDLERLCEIVEMLNQAQLYSCAWRWWIFTAATADIQRLGLPLVSPLMRTNIYGSAWRGGIWGFFLGILLTIIALALFDIEGGLALTIIMYSLPIILLSLGVLAGGLLGMLQDNPSLGNYRYYAEKNLFVFLVDVQLVDQRLLKKLMAKCSADQVGEHTQRMLGFPWRESVFNKTEIPAERI